MNILLIIFVYRWIDQGMKVGFRDGYSIDFLMYEII